MPRRARPRTTAGRSSQPPPMLRTSISQAPASFNGWARSSRSPATISGSNRTIVRGFVAVLMSWECGEIDSRVSTTTRCGERFSKPGNRQVSAGSSAASVPRPIRMASVRARSRWPLRAGLFARDPDGLAAASRSDQSIGRNGELQLDEGPPFRHAQQVPGMQPARFRIEHAGKDFDAGGAQDGQAAPGDALIGVGIGDDDALQAGLDDGLGAGAGLAVMRARLERHVHGGAARAGPGLSDGLGLGMRPAAGLRAAHGDDLAAVWAHDHRADGWVGRRRTQATARKLHGEVHEFAIDGCEFVLRHERVCDRRPVEGLRQSAILVLGARQSLEGSVSMRSQARLRRVWRPIPRARPEREPFLRRAPIR